jgi:hypothetical protein
MSDTLDTPTARVRAAFDVLLLEPSDDQRPFDDRIRIRRG